ncbi:MAG: hypothetical protein L0287_37285 [Anaerolineae bacterium]|nr:hypothetical protein [Anaerolineae bacterium]
MDTSLHEYLHSIAVICPRTFNPTVTANAMDLIALLGANTFSNCRANSAWTGACVRILPVHAQGC